MAAGSARALTPLSVHLEVRGLFFILMTAGKEMAQRKDEAAKFDTYHQVRSLDLEQS